jgi:hypothetical protein
MAATRTLLGNRATTLSLGGLLAGAALGGCIYVSEAPSYRPTSRLERVPEIRAAASPSGERADGRWNLRGDGSQRAPFHWAWVPTAAPGGGR